MVGQVTSAAAPDGSTTVVGYDPNGDLASPAPPGRPAYAFAYTSTCLVASSVAPTVGATPVTTTYSYGYDGSLPAFET